MTAKEGFDLHALPTRGRDGMLHPHGQCHRGCQARRFGGMVFDILDRDHVSYEMAGENIALNNYIDFYPMARTVRQTNTDLMNSPDHRANLLEPKYTEIGLGMAFENSSGKLIVTEVFVQR